MNKNDQYDYRIKHDIIKVNYCNSNNINLLVIPYWQIKDISNVIECKLNSLKTVTDCEC